MGRPSLGEITMEIESGRHEIVRGPSVAEVEDACHDVIRSLADAVMCLDFLAEVTKGDPREVIDDAKAAMERISRTINELRKTCGPALSIVARSGSG
jgi:hypothetical protein